MNHSNHLWPALIGVVGILFIAALSRRRTVLAAFAYALASDPVAIALS